MAAIVTPRADLRAKLILLLLLLPLLPGPAGAAAPPDLSGFAYRQNTGARLPLEAELRDSDGRAVPLGALGRGLPLILALGYFHCPDLCGLIRDDVFHGLAAARLVAGRDYSLAFVSIDPNETSADAQSAKRQDLAQYPQPGAEQAWHFLTGPAASVQAVARAVGFRDQPDQQSRQFIHPAGIVFATPGGVISSYLLGVGYTPTDIRAAVARADIGGVAAAATPILLLCFHFDPSTGRYTLAIMKVLRLAAGLTVLTLGGTLLLAFRRGRGRAEP